MLREFKKNMRKTSLNLESKRFVTLRYPFPYEIVFAPQEMTKEIALWLYTDMYVKTSALQEL